MPLRGAAIGPDAVLAWTGERELTRFDRTGERTRIELPFAPLAARIDIDGLIAVDARGSVHRFTLEGKHEAFVPLLESPGTIREAAVSADGHTLAILTDEVQVFEHGLVKPWSFGHRRFDWRETGVDLSASGDCVLVRYALLDSRGENLGDRLEAFSITRSDGRLLYRHAEAQLPPLEIVMAIEEGLLAICEHESIVRIGELRSMSTIHRVESTGHVHAMQFDRKRLGVLYDYQLVLVHDGGVRETRIDLPEQFEDFVLVGDEAVCIHPELGAWWIRLAAAAT